MATAIKFIKFFRLIVCFRCNFSLKNSIQFGNSSNCSLFTGENTAINGSMVTVLASVGLTKKRFGHQAILMIFSSRSPRTGKWTKANSTKINIMKEKNSQNRSTSRAGASEWKPENKLHFHCNEIWHFRILDSTYSQIRVYHLVSYDYGINQICREVLFICVITRKCTTIIVKPQVSRV